MIQLINSFLESFILVLSYFLLIYMDVCPLISKNNMSSLFWLKKNNFCMRISRNFTKQWIAFKMILNYYISKRQFQLNSTIKLMQDSQVTNNGKMLREELNSKEFPDIDELRIEDSNNELSEYKRKTTLLDRKTKLLTKTKVDTHRDFMSIFWISSILSISGLQFGYGICEITTVSPKNFLYEAYGFDMNPGLAMGLMVSLMPFGAIFGSVAASYYMKIFTRKNAHHICNMTCIVSSGLIMQIRNPAAILIGRFVYGYCIALYCAMSPLVIREISPINLRPIMGSVFSIGRVFAIVFGYFIGLMLYLGNVPEYYRIMFLVPGIMALIQSILMIPFVPDSPTELFGRKDLIKGRQVLQFIYKPEFVDTMFEQFKLESEVTAMKSKSEEIAKAEPYPELKPNMKRAFLMGCHLNIFRQMLGLNTLVSYAGIIVSETNPTIGPYTNFFVNGVELICTLIATFYVADRFGRRFLLLYSSIMIGISNYLITVGLLINDTIFTMVFMIIFMGTFGIAYSIVSWAYPAEILRPDQVPFASLTTWPALVITTLIPPIVIEAMPNNNAWPIFLFFGIYCTISTVYKWFCVVETKGKNYIEIIKEF